MSARDEVRVWDLPVRVFHWALVVCFVGAYVLSESEHWRQIHVMFGYTAVGLLAFRLMWGFIGTEHARFRSFAFSPREAFGYLRDELAGRARRYLGHNPAGSWAVYGLLAVTLATGVSGWLTFNEIGGDAFEEVHEVCANTWLALVVVHVLGVVFSSVLQRENLARAMITGRKRGAEAEAPGPHPRRGFGLALVAAVLGFWGWSLTTATPLPADSSAEEHEHEGHSAMVTERRSGDD